MNQALHMSALCIDRITQTPPLRQSDLMDIFAFAPAMAVARGIMFWGCTLYIVHRNVQYVCLRIALREFILKDDFIKMWFQRSKSLWTG